MEDVTAGEFNNSSSTFQNTELPALDPEIYLAVLPIHVLAILLAILSNMSTVVIIGKTPRLHTPSCLLLLLLSCSDLLLSIVWNVVPIAALNEEIRDTLHSSWICDFIGALWQTIMIFLVFLHAIVALDRYVFIVHPLKYIRRVTNKRALLAALIALLVSCAIVCCSAFIEGSKNNFRYLPSAMTCVGSSDWSIIFLAAAFLPSFIAATISYQQIWKVCANVIKNEAVSRPASSLTSPKPWCVASNSNSSRISVRTPDVQHSLMVEDIASIRNSCSDLSMVSRLTTNSSDTRDSSSRMAMTTTPIEHDNNTLRVNKLTTTTNIAGVTHLGFPDPNPLYYQPNLLSPTPSRRVSSAIAAFLKSPMTTIKTQMMEKRVNHDVTPNSDNNSIGDHDDSISLSVSRRPSFDVLAPSPTIKVIVTAPPSPYPTSQEEDHPPRIMNPSTTPISRACSSYDTLSPVFDIGHRSKTPDFNQRTVKNCKRTSSYSTSPSSDLFIGRNLMQWAAIVNPAITWLLFNDNTPQQRGEHPIINNDNKSSFFLNLPSSNSSCCYSGTNSLKDMIPQTTNLADRRRRMRVLFMILVPIFGMMASFLPFIVCLLYWNNGGSETTMAYSVILCHFIYALAPPTVSPFLSLSHKPYRRALIRRLCCCLKKI